MGRTQYWPQRCPLPPRSAVGTRTLHRWLWTTACIRAGGRKPGTILVQQFLLGHRPVRLLHRVGMELERRSDRDLRGSRPSWLVSGVQPTVRHVRSRRVPGSLTVTLECSRQVSRGHRLKRWFAELTNQRTRRTYATVPNSAPTPAVTAMANAPQNVTRIAPAARPAPPVCAANAPRSARNANEVPATRKMSPFSGANAATSSGIGAPTAKLAADANAA